MGGGLELFSFQGDSAVPYILLMQGVQGVWNRREIQLTLPALPYDYACLQIFRIVYCIRGNCTSDRYFLYKWSTLCKGCIIIFHTPWLSPNSPHSLCTPLACTDDINQEHEIIVYLFGEKHACSSKNGSGVLELRSKPLKTCTKRQLTLT